MSRGVHKCDHNEFGGKSCLRQISPTALINGGTHRAVRHVYGGTSCPMGHKRVTNTLKYD